MRYFAYGSNMLSARLRDRVNSASNPTPYALNGNQLRFHKRSSDGSGKGNVIDTGDPLDVVHGVIFDIEESQIADLELHEGVGHGYGCSIRRLCLHGTTHEVLMYVAEVGFTDDALVPYKWYLDLVIAGAEEHDLPRAYIAALRAVPYRQDPNPSRKTRQAALRQGTQTALPLIPAQGPRSYRTAIADGSDVMEDAEGVRSVSPRVCLIPLKTRTRSPSANLTRVAHRLEEAMWHRPDLICLPECTFTGYLYEEQDLMRFSEPIPGPTTQELAAMARRYHVHLCFGLLERTSGGVYNTAVLLGRQGDLLHRHRKVNEKPPFLNGDDVATVDTEFGRISILLCGDLFSEEAIGRLDRSLDLLIVPMSRSFDQRSPDAERWLQEERQAYLDAVQTAGRTTLLVNALDDVPVDGAFGGAIAVSGQGDLLAESPHGSDQALIVDLC